MLIVFPRLADYVRGYARIERDDGVIYRIDGGPVTVRLPHDLVHLTVEQHLAIGDGIWGAIAGGVVFRSMTHVDGRRRPHEAERSQAIKHRYGASLRWAEYMGGLVEQIAEAGTPTGRFSWPLAGYQPDQLLGAAQAVRTAAQQWRELPVGGELSVNWPGHRRIRLDPDWLRTGRYSPHRGGRRGASRTAA